jgi:hypothetical protein
LSAFPVELAADSADSSDELIARLGLRTLNESWKCVARLE